MTPRLGEGVCLISKIGLDKCNIEGSFLMRVKVKKGPLRDGENGYLHVSHQQHFPFFSLSLFLLIVVFLIIIIIAFYVFLLYITILVILCSLYFWYFPLINYIFTSQK